MNQPVAFIGLGNMGAPMAKNLIKEGYPLYVYNRSPDKISPLVSLGAIPLSHPSEAFHTCKIVISMLANDAALEEITVGPEGLLETVRPGAIHVSMSTVNPETTKRLETLHREKGAYLIAAPVFGRPVAAAAAKLVICMAGNPLAKREVEQLLKVLGNRVDDFGDEPATANIVKLCGNFMILSAIEAMGEACALAEKNGIGQEQLLSFFSETIFACPAYQTYAKILSEKKFEPAGFTMTLGLKDMTLVNKAQEAANINMPIASLLHTLLQDGVAEGRGDLDWTAITLSLKKMN